MQGCLSLAYISPHLTYNLYRQTYTKPVRNNLSFFQEKKNKDGNESGIMLPYWAQCSSFIMRIVRASTQDVVVLLGPADH